MKVLIIEHFIPESSYTLELGYELKRYVDLHILCRKCDVPVISGITMHNNLYFGGKQVVSAAFEYAKGLITTELELHKGYDIVHIQTFKNPRYEIPIYLRYKKRGGYLVHTVHNVLPHEMTASDRAIHSNFYEKCDLLVVHNEWCRQQLKDEFGIAFDKIIVMPHGAYRNVEVSKANEQKTQRLELLQFGMLRKYKGIDILIKAISLLPENLRAKVHVTVAGKQYPKLDDTDYSDMARRLGCEECFSFKIGYIDDNELPNLFQKADVCLFPYREISGSGALLMAYTYGKPVIASNLPVFCEETLDGSTGLLFETEDPASLAKAITQCIEWSKYDYDTYKGRIADLVENKYNWKRSAEILSQAYRSLGNNKNEE